jgi:hypothetical protein
MTEMRLENCLMKKSIELSAEISLHIKLYSREKVWKLHFQAQVWYLHWGDRNLRLVRELRLMAHQNFREMKMKIFNCWKQQCRTWTR